MCVCGGGGGCPGSAGRLSHVSQHAQPVRPDFGRLLVPGKQTVDPFRACLMGPGPELSSRLRTSPGTASSLGQHLPFACS